MHHMECLILCYLKWKKAPTDPKRRRTTNKLLDDELNWLDVLSATPLTIPSVVLVTPAATFPAALLIRDPPIGVNSATPPRPHNPALVRSRRTFFPSGFVFLKNPFLGGICIRIPYTKKKLFFVIFFLVQSIQWLHQRNNRNYPCPNSPKISVIPRMRTGHRSIQKMYAWASDP